MNNKPLPIYGNGTNSREWIYVKDHCEALIKVFQKGKLGEFYNIGSNRNFNNLQITKKLINIAKKHIKIGRNVKIKFVQDRPGHDKRYSLDSNKIYKHILWRSTTDINVGLNKTFKWYIDNELFFKKMNKNLIKKRLGKL